jgi:hypothetical protein
MCGIEGMTVQVRIDKVGDQGAPVIVVDDVWPDARALFETAAQRTNYARTSIYYPGLRSAAPREYAEGIVASLRDVMRDVFAVSDITITDSTFSLVTMPPRDLVPFQRVPHYDSADPSRFALLHYLCNAGGTSFYRHRSSRTEIIDAGNEEKYISTVNAEVRATGMPPPSYVGGDSELFECIASYQAVFNRALIYRGSMLHSVNVPPGFVPDTNPRSGRLTVNTFLIARATP